jgi:hypothetical protein
VAVQSAAKKPTLKYMMSVHTAATLDTLLALISRALLILTKKGNGQTFRHAQPLSVTISLSPTVTLPLKLGKQLVSALW